MQEGSFRCDANVSVRPQGQTELGTRAEVKNLNSFRFVEKAINFEIERQIDVIESGAKVVQETRLYDSGKDETRSMRSKEEANDYRSFPDPDLLPLRIDPEYIETVRQTLPELPDQKRQRFIDEYALSSYDAEVLSASKELANFYEAVVSESGCDPKLCANWVSGEFAAALNKSALDIAQSTVQAPALAGLIKRIEDNTISGKIAKEVLEAMFNSEGSADQIIEQKGLKQITDSSAIEAIIDQIIADSPQQVEQYRNGKEKLFGYFVGQVMKQTQGKANPAQVNQILKAKL
jgi:aspartyl-tRNA(Asn)/glutamyl-tRNA(Gln) amidotransferase subunit B